MSSAQLLLGLCFSSLGVGYALYGRRQRRISALVAGLALMVYPYFVNSTILLLGLGVALAVIPFLIDF